MRPSPPHLTQLTASVCDDIENSVCRVTASHTRMLVSLEPVTKRRDGSARWAGSHAIDVIHLLCPCKAWAKKVSQLLR